MKISNIPHLSDAPGADNFTSVGALIDVAGLITPPSM